MAGFISIERSLFEHWIWSDKNPFDKRSAWVDLIGMAAHADHKGKSYEGKITVIKRGEIHTSISFLATRWKWERKTVKRFLSCLQDDGMLTFRSTTNGKTGGTVITIEKYNFYQRKRTVNDTVNGTVKSQSSPSQVPYHNNETNNKNNNNGWQRPEDKPWTVDEVFEDFWKRRGQ